MANLSKTVEIIFAGKNELSSVVGDIETKFGLLNTSLTQITAPLAGIADTILKIDAALAALAVGGMAYAIKQSSEFNKSFALISTSISATGGDLAKYRDDVLNYSTTSVKSMADINASLYTAAQAGVKYTDSLAFIRKAEELSVANNANLNTTVDLLTSTMNAYGFTIKDVAHLNDVFFTSTLIGKQTIDDLGQSMGQVVGIAANSGVSFEELSAAIATLTAKGTDTAEAITAIKGVITTIVAPSKEASDAAKKLGLNFSLTELTSKGLSKMLTEIMTKTGGSKQKITELFGEVRAMNGILQLTGDSMAFFNDAMNQTSKSAGSAESAYKKMVGTFANQSQMISNTFQTAIISIGSKLEPIVAEIGGSIGGIFSGIKAAVDSGAFAPLFQYLDDVGKKLAQQLSTVAKNLPEAMKGIDFSGLINSLNGLGGAIGDAFKAIFGQIDLSTPEGLHDVIQKIINGMASLIDVTKGIVDGMKPLFAAIGEAVKGFSSLDTSSASAIGNILGTAKAINTLVEYAGLLTGALGLLAGRAVVEAGKAMVSLGASAVSAVPGIAAFISNLGLLGSLGALGAAAAVGYMTGTLLNQIPAVQKGGQALLGLIDIHGDFFGASGKTKDQMAEVNKRFDEAVAKHKAMATSLDNASAAMGKAKEGAATLEGAMKMVRDSMGKAGEWVDIFGNKFNALPSNKTINIEIKADGTKIETTKDMIYKYFPDGQVLITNIGTKAHEESLLATKNKLDEVIPPEKQIEIQAKIDEAKIKEQSEIVQKSIEWTAKVDIAKVEAAAKVIEAAFESVNNTINSTGTLTASLTEQWATLMGSGKGGTSFIEGQIRTENENRQKALAMQENLTNAQVDYLNATTDAMKKGDAIIKIDGTGLKPHLEAFMYEILAAIQVKANAAGQKFLVGI